MIHIDELVTEISTAQDTSQNKMYFTLRVQTKGISFCHVLSGENYILWVRIYSCNGLTGDILWAVAPVLAIL